MPTYELAFIIRQLPRLEIVSALKRTAESIFDKGGVIRQFDNLGTQDIPYKISAKGAVHKVGSYFVIKFDAPPATIDDLTEEYSRDVDIIRKHVFKVDKEEPIIECTLHDELLPPAYRKDVQEMITLGKRNQKPGFKYNSGLDYYPFQK